MADWTALRKSAEALRDSAEQMRAKVGGTSIVEKAIYRPPNGKGKALVNKAYVRGAQRRQRFMRAG
jgi:hypothetical protein